jgi:hypothetical protein
MKLSPGVIGVEVLEAEPFTTIHWGDLIKEKHMKEGHDSS